MARPHRRQPWLQVRLAVYLLVVAAFLIVRSGKDWRLPFGTKTGSSSLGNGVLPISGLDVAPNLIRELVADYELEYPKQHIDLQRGGTNQALEALINHQSDIAFLLRPPSPSEQALFRKADEDTVLWYPVALGALVIVRAKDGPAVTLDELRGFVMGESKAGFTHIYAPDPNFGAWDAFLDLARIPRGQEPETDRIVFLKDEGEVLKAVKEDSLGIGLGTSFTLPADVAAGDVDTVAIRSAHGDVLPTREAILSGDYPLYHYVYAACRENGSALGAMFLTYLTSNRGQRHVEKAGFLPTREIQRTVVVTRTPIGRTS
jgi:ABC-type phosphate transport system substrate-binding protein